jgi:hypothetical protein
MPGRCVDPRDSAMRKVSACVIFSLLFLLFVGAIGCGDNLRVVENEYISFTLGNDFEYAFVDPNPDAPSPDFPLGDQLRVVIWDKDNPSAFSIFIYYPCPPDVSDRLEDASSRTVNGVEVLSSAIEGFNLQAYLDPVMTVGVSSLLGEAFSSEAKQIVESLEVRKSSN